MYNPSKPYKKEILELIQNTWQTPYLDVESSIYPIFTKKFSYSEVDHTDGIGTKGYYHWKKQTFKNAAQDALAMNLNDFALVRAIPYKLQNHIQIPKDDSGSILEIMGALAGECRKRSIAMTGGETSIQNNVDGVEVSLTVSGFIPTPKPNQFQIGDILVGLKSNGLHSNGFTKVREIFGDEIREESTEPTALYLDTILELNEKVDIHGMMHITGGAYTKLKDVLSGGAEIEITNTHALKPQTIFYELHKKGKVTDEEMYRTFNCGIGFIFSISPTDKEKIAFNKNCVYIGEVVRGAGKVKIHSMFSNQTIEL